MSINARLGAAAALLGGLLMGLGMAIHPDEADPSAFADARWGPAHWLMLTAALLMLLALPRIYDRYLAADGALGVLAYALLMIGHGLLAGLAMLEAAVIAPLAARPEWAAAVAEDGPIMTSLLGSVLPVMIGTLLVGSLVFAWLAWKGGRLPKGVALLVGLGGAGASLSPPLPYPVLPIAGVLLGLGLAWIGWLMLGQGGSNA